MVAMDVNDLRCPCGGALRAEDMDMVAGLATCPACGLARPLAQWMRTFAQDRFAYEAARAACAQPPRGCRAIEGPWGCTLTVETRNRAQGAMWLTCGVLLAGITMFAGNQGASKPLPLSQTLGFAALALPAFGLGLFMMWLAGRNFLGRTVVRIGGTRGLVRCGVGPVGRARRFDQREVTCVALHHPHVPGAPEPLTDEGNGAWTILIEAGNRKIDFGRFMSPDQRLWLLGMLSQKLSDPSNAAQQRPRS